MRDSEHINEIDRVLRGQATGRDGFVSESWRRCVESYGMDPSRRTAPHIVTEGELRRHREQTERLIAIARSGLAALFRQVAGQNYVLLLADAKGVTVDFFGDPRFEDELRDAGLYLGSDWSEQLAGTCGVGSCIVTGEAMTIHQGDHFDLSHTPLSCTAAPILDTTGALAAVLDISLLRSPQPKISQNLAMNLVQASARRVEMANLMATTRGHWVLRFSHRPEFLEVDPDAAIALDDGGRITGLTRGAMEMLAPCAPDGAVLGQPLERFMEISVDDLPELMRGRPAEERVIRLCDSRAIFGHAIAPQSARVVRPPTEKSLPSSLASFGGHDPAIARLVADAARLARSDVPLLITGETGTGKERLARAIHVCTPKSRPFLSLACAGLTPEAIDRLPDADGTLYLDEPGDLPLTTQARLADRLNSLQLRPISASGTDLAALTREGRFRADLFFRLAGARLTVPPLRHRRDFDWLLDRLLRRRSGTVPTLSPAARAELKARPWPGNVRELISTLDAAVALAGGPVIDLPDLPKPVFDPAGTSEAEDDLEAVLAACDWNMAQAARRLGVNRSTVLRRVRKSGLRPHGLGPIAH